MGTLTVCGLDLKTLADIVMSVTAIVTIVLAFCEFNEHKRRNSIQYLLSFGKRYTENEEIKNVIIFLEGLEDDNMYKSEFLKPDNTYNEDALPIHCIEMFMRFIEELELLIRGGVVSESATLNLFGHYTTILDKYNKRWPSLKYDEKYWNVYRSFVEKAKRFNYNNVMI